MAKPYCCPVCGGRGWVSDGFYENFPLSTSINFGAKEPCRSCNGSGIIWDLNFNPPYNPPDDTWT